MLVCTLGDLMLDVVVGLDGALVPGGDVPARSVVGAGGQAANVAAWAAALGARARLVARTGDDDAAALAAAALARANVELAGPRAAGATGVVVSLVDPGGERTMASDRGAAAGLRADELDPAWLACDHLHVSGYALTAEPARGAALRAVELARAAGARVSVDAGAATVVERVGRPALRALLERLAPDAVFVNADEDAALGGPVAGPVWIVKQGPGGALVDGVAHPAAPAEAVDATGAGDAFAAGWIVGGIGLALEAAARCVARMGAFPALS
jgi:sugar/nucleoside kinase (ribokinase family)